MEEWDIPLREHHEGYIDWAEFERNQKQLPVNAYGKAGDVKSSRGRRTLLADRLACARCGRRLSVAYTGLIPQAVYRCDRLTMSDAAELLGVTHYMIRGLINDRIVPAEQVVSDAPWQIRASDVRSDAVRRPYRANIARGAMMRKGKSRCLTRSRKEVHNECPIAHGRIWFSTQLLSIGT